MQLHVYTGIWKYYSCCAAPCEVLFLQLVSRCASILCLASKWTTTFYLVSIMLVDIKGMWKITNQKNEAIFCCCFVDFLQFLVFDMKTRVWYMLVSMQSIVTPSKAEMGSVGKINISFVSAAVITTAFDQTNFCSLKNMIKYFSFIAAIFYLIPWQYC